MQNIANAISIPKGSFCPCGSGKSFHECCEHKNHLYESLVINENGDSVIYDKTEIINAVKNLNCFIESRINSTSSRISQIEAFRKLKRLYEKLGSALLPMSRVTSCRAGCGHCCCLLVLTSQLEADMIKEYIASHYSVEQFTEFKEKIARNKSMLSNIKSNKDGTFSKESTEAYLSSRTPCAFLDNESRCSIYEARPFICRKYLVFDNPEVCTNPFNKTNQYYSGYHSNVKDALIKLNQLTYGTNYKYKHLLSWFVE